MRATRPIPAERWPHDMVITVEDRPHALIDLLWTREAYRLRPSGDDVPPNLCDTPPPASNSSIDAATRIQWENAWPAAWRAAVEHAGKEQDHSLFQRVQRLADGSAERIELLRQIVGPDWRAELGDAAFSDPSYEVWSQRGQDVHAKALPQRLSDSPERRDMDALIPAWRSGLRKVVTIPCIGEFTRKIGNHAILVTENTRAGADSYRHALSTFS